VVIWRGGVDQRLITPRQISPQSVKGWVDLITKKVIKISACKRPAGLYPLGDFYQIFNICSVTY